MKRSLRNPGTLVLFITILWLSSCQKEILQGSSVNEINLKIKSWLKTQKKTVVPALTDRVTRLEENLDFPHTRIEESEQGEKIAIVPVKNGINTMNYIEQNSSPSLVLLLDNNGNIRKGNLVLYTPLAIQEKQDLPANTFYHIFNTATPECNGYFRFLSITGRWLYQLEYRDHQLYSYSSLDPKTAPATNNTNSEQVCIDWYLVTTVTYSDGSTYTIEEYVGTTCGCVSTVPARYNVEDPNCEGGGSGGSETGGFEEDEFAMVRDVAWNVYNPYGPTTPGVGDGVNSVERIRGKKKGQGGYFSKITHISSECNACSPSVYVEDSNSVSISGQQASSSVTGHYYVNQTRRDISNTKSWGFSEVF